MNRRVTPPSTSTHPSTTTSSRRRRLGFAASTLGLATTSLALVALAAPAANAASPDHSCEVVGNSIACTDTYTFADAEETYVVPDGITSLAVFLVGAPGAGWGGRGAAVYAGSLPVSPSDTFFVAVGGNGGSSAAPFNGGGYSSVGLSGGGATDVRTVSASGDTAASLASRILVAGGGGSGGDGGAGSPYNGGDAGFDGITPGNAQFAGPWTAGGGGTQTEGGYGGSGSSGYGAGGGGTLGAGGSGGDFFGSYGGGGGGGLYGGGGGGIFNGGGGGSSLLTPGATATVNTTGKEPQAAFTYSRPVTGMTSVSGDASTKAGTPVVYAVNLTDGTESASTAPETLSISPDDEGTGATCTATTCSATKVGTYQVTAGFGAFEGTTTLTVVPAGLATSHLEPADQSVIAGEPVSYSVFGSDAYGNALDEQTGASTITVAPVGGGDSNACPRGVCRVTDAGSYVVTSTTPGADGDVVATTSLAALPGALASLHVTPGTAQTRTGVPVTYTVNGADRFGNDLGDLTEYAELTLVPLEGGDPVDCDGADCTPYGAGTYRVEARLDDASGVASLHAVPTRTTIAVDPDGDTTGLTFGDDVPVFALITSPDGPAPGGLVQFTLDNQAIGDPVAVADDGVAQVPDLQNVDAGLHTLRAEFGSEPAGMFAPASGQTSFVVAQAPTTTEVTVQPGSITAVVSAGPLPTPTGLVQFALNGQDLGSAPLVDGTAVLETDTTVAHDATVSGLYGGGANYLPSAGSTARKDPEVTTTVTALGGAAPVAGWYRSPVTVSFDCVAGSAPVTCPEPVVLDQEGAGQTVTRSVLAEDGGLTVVTAGPVSIDLTAPTAKVTGVAEGKVYNGPTRAPTCEASDALSGLASCTLTTTGQFPGVQVTTATAVDQAGNTTTSTVTYRTRDLWVGNLAQVKGAWPVETGKSVPLLVASNKRPVLTGKLVRPGDGFRWAGYKNGVARWSSLVRMPATAKPGDVVIYWVEIGGVTRKVRLLAVKH